MINDILGMSHIQNTVTTVKVCSITDLFKMLKHFQGRSTLLHQILIYLSTYKAVVCTLHKH